MSASLDAHVASRVRIATAKWLVRDLFEEIGDERIRKKKPKKYGD
jgi:hypothetical protein